MLQMKYHIHQVIQGGIANKGSLSKTLNPGGSYTLTTGRYSSGTITANANQNSETYTATTRSASNNTTSWHLHCFVTLGTPSYSVSGGYLTVNIPEEVRPVSRLEPNSYSTSYGVGYNRTISAKFKIN